MWSTSGVLTLRMRHNDLLLTGDKNWPHDLNLDFLCSEVTQWPVGRRLRPAILEKATYRDRLKALYVVARNVFLLLLNFSAWPYLAVALQNLHSF